MPEPVDRLKLVADEENFLLAGPAGEEVDQLALQPIRVLELIDHHGPEPELLAGANRGVVAQEVARAELQVLEVECGLLVLRLLVGGREPGEQLLQQVAVARGQLVERRLLDSASSLLIACGALAPELQASELEQPGGPGLGLRQP